MRVTHALLLLALAFLLLPAALRAQDVVSPAADPAPVFIQERSPVLAGVLDVFIPTAGYAYAGNWKRGLPSAAVRVVGLVLVMEHIVVTPLWGETDCDAGCIIGQVLLLGGTAWAGWDAAATARRTNERLRSRVLGLTLAPSGSGGMRMGVRLASPF